MVCSILSTVYPRHSIENRSLHDADQAYADLCCLMPDYADHENDSVQGSPLFPTFSSHLPFLPRNVGKNNEIHLLLRFSVSEPKSHLPTCQWCDYSNKKIDMNVVM